HIHRIGRTGRVDAEGWAFSLASANQAKRVAAIAAALGRSVEWHPLAEIQPAAGAPLKPLVPAMVTLLILGGRKDKIRPGDILGALTGEAGFSKEQIGKINVTDSVTYVAVERSIGREALQKLSAGTVKGKRVKVHFLQVGG
ncbi:MAG: DbpA RNA binding domain-containing protein, partial [Rhodocyclaceae bacterium]|nr:DbpA RNA binding domain-containing protein [Rhodocyclaceae bacterium]